MTWRHGMPPKSGTYQVKWDPEDDGSEEIIIVLASSPAGEAFAVWRHTEIEDDDPEVYEVYPGSDTPYAVWLDETPLVGSPTPQPPVVDDVGYRITAAIDLRRCLICRHAIFTHGIANDCGCCAQLRAVPVRLAEPAPRFTEVSPPPTAEQIAWLRSRPRDTFQVACLHGGGAIQRLVGGWRCGTCGKQWLRNEDAHPVDHECAECAGPETRLQEDGKNR
jgi:hypothetical protein